MTLTCRGPLISVRNTSRMKSQALRAGVSAPCNCARNFGMREVAGAPPPNTRAFFSEHLLQEDAGRIGCFHDLVVHTPEKAQSVENAAGFVCAVMSTITRSNSASLFASRLTPLSIVAFMILDPSPSNTHPTNALKCVAGMSPALDSPADLHFFLQISNNFFTALAADS